jgi:hypothetical protein
MSVSYAVWGMSVVFVKHPYLRGLYLKTHPCVISVACPLTLPKRKWNCGAQIGEPCMNLHGEPSSQTHHERRVAFAKTTREKRLKAAVRRGADRG